MRSFGRIQQAGTSAAAWLPLGLGAIGPGLTNEVSGQSLRPFPPPFEIRVPVPPAPITSGGDQYLFYELIIMSFMPAPTEVSRVEVYAESPAGPRLLDYSGEELSQNMVPPGSTEEDPVAQRTIGPRSHGVVFMMLPFAGSVSIPSQLYHRVWFELPTGEGTESDYVDFETSVLPSSSVIEIGPPLRGGPWAVFNGPSNDTGHRRAALQLHGRSAFAQRYAMDYMLLDAEGRAAPVEGGGNETYPGYGQEVIAVADGVITTVFDGVPENTPGVTTRPEVFNLSTAIGNHVILDLGNGHFALFAHLLPGSLRVRVGQQVRRGDVLGQVGNSGNSGGPHLHFHVTDDDLPLGAEGLPYVIDAFELLGTCDRALGECTIGEGESRRHETPLRNQVVRFPG